MKKQKLVKKKIISKDRDVPKILSQDGIETVITKFENRSIHHTDIIKKKYRSKKSWAYRAINTKSNSATLISQKPGDGNRIHYHPNWDEWWFIIKGKAKFEINKKSFTVKKGDLVLIKRNNIHKITATGKSNCIRLAVSRADVDHIYV